MARLGHKEKSADPELDERGTPPRRPANFRKLG